MGKANDQHRTGYGHLPLRAEFFCLQARPVPGDAGGHFAQRRAIPAAVRLRGCSQSSLQAFEGHESQAAGDEQQILECHDGKRWSATDFRSKATRNTKKYDLPLVRQGRGGCGRFYVETFPDSAVGAVHRARSPPRRSDPPYFGSSACSAAMLNSSKFTSNYRVAT